MEIKRILIVCVGNICRSPMAAALMEKMLNTQDMGSIQVTSAGIGALIGSPADEHVQTLLSAEGLDASRHRARQLTLRMLSESDLVLVMDRHQLRELHSMAPYARGKTFLLGEWTQQEIPDPYRSDLETFRRVLRLIHAAVSSWQEKIY